MRGRLIGGFLLLLLPTLCSCEWRHSWLPIRDSEDSARQSILVDRSISRSLAGVSTKVSGSQSALWSTFSWEVTNGRSEEILVDLSGVRVESLSNPAESWEPEELRHRRADGVVERWNGPERVSMRVPPGDSVALEFRFFSLGGPKIVLRVPVAASEGTLRFEYPFTSS